MDLRLDEQQRAFRDEVREWLGQHALRETFAPASTYEGVLQRRVWEKTMYDGGLPPYNGPSSTADAA